MVCVALLMQDANRALDQGRRVRMHEGVEELIS